jgi:PAS domain S-box-containing protein
MGNNGGDEQADAGDDSKARLAAIVESSDDAIVSKNLDGIIMSWNRGAERVFGYSAEEAIGKHITLIIPEERLSEETLIIARIKAGERIDHFDTIRRRKDGSLVPISLTVSPVKSPSGRIIGASKIARDISERRRLEEAQRVLSKEVNHRSKNLLAVVQSIIRYTATHSPKEDFIRRINDRLQALATNQDLLIENSWRGADLEALVRFQLAQVERLPAGRVTVEGESMFLVPTAAQAIGMALHELATNAVKFGALSGDRGTVAVSWRIEVLDSEQKLAFYWRETGGPEVAAPEYAGFGTTILERITGQSLSGRVTTTYARSGLAWELRAPAATVLASPQRTTPVASGTNG